MRWIATLFMLVALACASSADQIGQIPQESLERMQNVFGEVRDQLWEKNDDFWHHGEFNRCIANMRIITSMDPHDTQAYEDASWLMDSDLREEDAEAFLREGLGNNPNVYDLYFELGNFLYFRTRYDEAIPLYTSCLTFDVPDYIRHQLAQAYEHGGYIGDALDTWLESEAMEPGDAIPPMHIDRIMQGGEPSHVPESMLKSIEHRKQERLEEQKSKIP